MLASAKSLMQRLIRNCGYEVQKLPDAQRSMLRGAHGDVHPLATYSPWITDEEFARVFQVVRSHTLVDIYRCYELWELVGEVSRFAKGDLIEVGVWRGGTGGLLAAKCRLCGLQAPIYLCDTFSGVVKAGQHDTDYTGGEHADTSADIVLKLMTRLQVSNVKILQGMFPEETGSPIADRTFRFCHIDVDVYQSAKDTLEWIWPRMERGGVIVFDDYGFRSCEGITRLVNEQRSHSDRVVIHNLNGHALAIKIT